MRSYSNGLAISVAALLVFCVGCTVRTEIIGQGDISSQSGQYDCSAAQGACSSQHLEGEDYGRLLTPNPQNGWEFARWDGCTSIEGNRCRLAGIVSQNNLNQTWTITAYFSPASTIELISAKEGSGGTMGGNGRSVNASISANGRYVVYESDSSDLGGGQDNHPYSDVYFYDRTTKTTENLTSEASVATPSSNQVVRSERPDVSADGRYIPLISDARLSADHGAFQDIRYMFDRDKQIAFGVGPTPSRPASGDSRLGHPRVSNDGRYMVYATDIALTDDDPNVQVDSYLWDRDTRELRLLSGSVLATQAGQVNYDPQISGNGRFVVWESTVPEFEGQADDNGETSDIYIFDQTTNRTQRITQGDQPCASGDTQISANGRYVTYTCGGDVFLYNRSNRATTNVSNTSSRFSNVSNPHISGNGRYLAYILRPTSDLEFEVRLYNVRTNEDRLIISQDSSALEDISHDGKVLVISSGDALVPGDTNGEVDVYVIDLRATL